MSAKAPNLFLFVSDEQNNLPGKMHDRDGKKWVITLIKRRHKAALE